VSETLGHSQIGITLDIYSHVLPSQRKLVAQKLDSLFASFEDGVKSGVNEEPSTAEGDKDFPLSFGICGEPRFRELEPDWQMAQTGGGASRRCLIGVDDASRL
jgi:hypothetical protein